MRHSQRQFKVRNFESDLPLVPVRRPVHLDVSPTATDAQVHQGPGSRPRPPARMAASVWRDALVGLLLCAAMIGVLSYFLGWPTAIGAFVLIVASLAWCINNSTKHTIEL